MEIQRLRGGLRFAFARLQGQRLPNANASRWREGGDYFLLPQHLLALQRRDHRDFQRQKGRNCIAYARRFDQSLASNLEASIRV